jgi:ribonuclease D
METITKEEIAKLSIGKYEGAICLVSSEQELTQAIDVIRREKVVGIDTETKPTFRKNQFHLPCLVQIATATAAYLFQLKRMDFSKALSEVLENSALAKAGVGLTNDLLGLRKVFSFKPRNIVDLSLVAQGQGIEQSGIRNLAARLLGFRVTKGCSTSNWDRFTLTPKQIAYAATDAWVCRELYLRFRQLGFFEG